MLYTAFCSHFNLQDFPASPGSLVLFGEFLLRGYRAPKSITNALASVKGFHLNRDLDAGAFESRQLTLFRRSITHTVRHVPTRAPPLPLEALEKLCRYARRQGPRGLAFASLLSVSFFAMTRLSSLAPPNTAAYDFTRYPSFADLGVTDEGVFISIKWAKCRQAAGQAYSVPLPTLGSSPACPVSLLTELAAGVRGVPARTPLFSFATRGPRSSPHHLTASRARSWLAALLPQLGLGDQGYTFHSLRRGACTRAYQGGASLPDLQFLGDWRGSSVGLYVPATAARARAAACLATGPLPSQT